MARERIAYIREFPAGATCYEACIQALFAFSVYHNILARGGQDWLLFEHFDALGEELMGQGPEKMSEVLCRKP